MAESLLTNAIGELGAGDLRTLLGRTDRSRDGTASELRPRLREAVRAGELAPEDLLRRLDEDALESLWAHAGLEAPKTKKHAELLHGIAAAIKKEPDERAKGRKKSKGAPALTELEQLREDVERLLDERAKLEAKVRRIEHDLEHQRSGAGLDLAPDDLGELLRGIGIPDLNAYRRMYRPAAKLLHPDKNKDGEAAFRLLTRIRDLLEGR